MVGKKWSQGRWWDERMRHWEGEFGARLDGLPKRMTGIGHAVKTGHISDVAWNALSRSFEVKLGVEYYGRRWWFWWEFGPFGPEPHAFLTHEAYNLARTLTRIDRKRQQHGLEVEW